jgi:hypothetical protein
MCLTKVLFGIIKGWIIYSSRSIQRGKENETREMDFPSSSFHSPESIKQFQIPSLNSSISDTADNPMNASFFSQIRASDQIGPAKTAAKYPSKRDSLFGSSNDSSSSNKHSICNEEY